MGYGVIRSAIVKGPKGTFRTVLTDSLTTEGAALHRLLLQLQFNINHAAVGNLLIPLLESCLFDACVGRYVQAMDSCV